MGNIMAVAAGGAIGSVFHYLLSEVTNKSLQLGFPWGTVTVNLIGCFLIGFGAEHLLTQAHQSVFRLFILIGVLGGFTTYSAFALESVQMDQTRAASIDRYLYFIV